MKKLYSLVIGAVMVTGALAQTTPNFVTPFKAPRTPVSIPQKPVQPLATNQFIIDYDSSDAAYQYSTFAYQYDRFIWDFNYHYVATDSSLKYFIVAFDSLHDSYSTTTTGGYALSTVNNVRVDSIYMFLGQENNSGVADTIITKLVTVNTNGYPTTTVVWDDTLIVNPGDFGTTDWLQTVALSIPCGYTFPTSDRFAIRVEYWGDKTDTCGWIAGFGNQAPLGSCASFAAAQTGFSAWKYSGNNIYYGNTFSYWTQYGVLLPTATAGHIYYDCDNSGSYGAGNDGETYLQNMSVMAMITTDPLGVDEFGNMNMKLSQNKPNPFTGSTTVTYELSEQANDVTLVVYDISGKEVMSFAEGNQNAGKHNITIDGSNLDAGVYFYTLVADGVKLTNKMTIVK